jgi:hypothetical protein
MLPSLAARDAQTAHSQFPCVAPKLEHVSPRNCKDNPLETTKPLPQTTFHARFLGLANPSALSISNYTTVANGMATRYQPESPGFESRQRREIPCFSKRPHRCRAHISGGSYPKVKSPAREGDRRPPSIAKLTITGAIPLFPLHAFTARPGTALPSPLTLQSAMYSIHERTKLTWRFRGTSRGARSQGNKAGLHVKWGKLPPSSRTQWHRRRRESFPLCRLIINTAT